jgi:NADPH:quinone reductase-like Zn-dependent oxidoreductase
LSVKVADKTQEGRTFAPVVDHIFTFADAAAAHHHLQDRRNFGKVLLKP